MNLIDIEAHARQVGWVVAEPLEVFDAVVAAHIPTDVMRVLHHDFGNGRCPRTAADNRYFSAIIHVQSTAEFPRPMVSPVRVCIF